MIRLLAACSVLCAGTVAAQSADPLAPVPDNEPDEEVLTTPVPAPPPVTPVVRPVVVPKDWRGVFAAIRAGDWGSAQAGIDALPASPLKAVARAELYTARNSPRVDAAPIMALLAEAPDLPQAQQLVRLAQARGATDIPPIAPSYRLVPLPSAPRRHRSRAVAGDPVADTLRAAFEPYVKADDATGAEALYLQNVPMLTPEARAEAANRVAWIYYITNRDADVRRIALDGLSGGAAGEWAGQLNWTAGLASWRQNDCESASRHFKAVAYGRAETELAAAGAYWAARAEQACRRPNAVAPLLKASARSPESFYGLIARQTLGIAASVTPPARAPASVDQLPNVRRAVELYAIGERALAETFVRHQARIGRPADHGALIAKAREMHLPGTVYWLAHNGPQGARATTADRFPLPSWQPTGGWRVEPALAYAHARQESDFRHAAVSPAGAVGLMQVRPGTAGDFARARGTTLGNLADPATNLEYGQSFIELMRTHPSTQGQILKVMAAYNAGPVPVGRWNSLYDKNDPLLWIESLPYWETRYYVPAVLRNMWVYEALEGVSRPTLKALAEHKWPPFPDRRRR